MREAAQREQSDHRHMKLCPLCKLRREVEMEQIQNENERDRQTDRQTDTQSERDRERDGEKQKER